MTRNELYPEHLKDLRASGLNKETIKSAGFYSAGVVEMRQHFKILPAKSSYLVIPYSQDGFFRVKCFPPVKRKGAKKPAKYLQSPDTTPHLYVPDSMRMALHDFGSELIIAEGEKKTLKGVQEGLPCIGVAGIWNWIQKDEDGNASSIPELDQIAWVERNITLVFDSDIWANTQAKQGMYALGRELEDRGARVEVVLLRPQNGRKVGMDDYLVKHTVEDFENLKRIDLKHKTFSKEKKWYPRWSKRKLGDKLVPSTLPRINAQNENLPEVAKQCWKALRATNDPPRLFSQGAGLVALSKHPHLAISPLDEDRLRLELTRSAQWYKTLNDGREVVTYPHSIVLRDLLAHPEPPLPELTRIAEYPFYTEEGILHTKPGYSEQAKCYCRFSVRIPKLVEKPLPELVKKARELIYELVHDFPFINESERAHALAFAILPFVREMIGGPTPLHAFDAPEPGTGKSLLVAALTSIALGRSAPSATETYAKDEWRKKITSVLIDAPTFVFFDNINQTLSSGALSSAITSSFWKDRILGKSQDVYLPIRCAWAVSGNNLQLSSELARRTVRIRLDAKMDRPWERDLNSFRHPNLPKWTSENRPKLIGAVLALVNHWLTEGQPGSDLHLGSFEDWSDVIGGILECARIPGFLGNLKEFYEEADAEGRDIRLFIQVWWENLKDQIVGVKELYKLIKDEEIPLYLGRATSEQGERIYLGQRILQKIKGRQFDEIRVESAGTHKHLQQYQLIQVKMKKSPQTSSAEPKKGVVVTDVSGASEF